MIKGSQLIARIMALAFACTLSPAASRASDNPCELPFERMEDPRNSGRPFLRAQAINELPGVDDQFRNRFLVADLNTLDENGRCRGIEERFPAPGDFRAFPDLVSDADLRHFAAQVARYYPERGPLRKPGVFNHGGARICIGQTISLCEMLPGGQTREVARLATSSANNNRGYPRPGYYAPYNFINTRHWEAPSDRPYTPADQGRDRRMGGTTASGASGFSVAKFKERAIMPNFMNFVGERGYPSVNENGIHKRIALEGGLDGDLGTPSSLGCLRVTHYASRLSRFWTPRGAKFFIHFEPRRYARYADQQSPR